ncbi:17.9 kDa class II heat shock protein-like [Salvia miltiorrhiza]|uniref:17.9 kDa class II heat shock protein-like n=1 Tax=Salvia miltiorrhiza TaxID=226208 RepID=UPI0025ACE941|nr:17.9 kDa class II heat shock protein-like [Salvia miltiorrhiza]
MMKSRTCRCFPEASVFVLFFFYPLTCRCFPEASVHVGMIQVGLKPTKLGSNTSAIICLRDKRIPKYLDSICGRVESSLCDGPIYFSYYPNHCVHLSDSCKSFTIDVKIKGSEVGISATLMYMFHYRVVKRPYLMNFYPVDERGQTTLHLTDIAQSNRVVLKTITWDPARKGEGSTVEDEEAGGADVDWKETAEGHVVKVDVPGFKKEEVRVAVEEGGIVQISGERSNEEEGDKLHCKERGKGKFLRRLRLPENANLEGLEARLENGLLTVTVPKKKKKKKPEVKIVDISG